MEKDLEYIKETIRDALRIFRKQIKHYAETDDHWNLILAQAKIDAYRDIESRIEFYEKYYGESKED